MKVVKERIQYNKTMTLPCCKHDGGICNLEKCGFVCALCRSAGESICNDCNLFEDETPLEQERDMRGTHDSHAKITPEERQRKIDANKLRDYKEAMLTLERKVKSLTQERDTLREDNTAVVRAFRSEVADNVFTDTNGCYQYEEWVKCNHCDTVNIQKCIDTYVENAIAQVKGGSDE